MNVIETICQENAKELKECTARLKSLAKKIHDPVLIEGKCAPKNARLLVKEAILYERLVILEAAGQDVHHLAEMMEGMKMSAEMLAKRIGAEGLQSKLDSIRVPDVFELDAMSISKPHLKKFMKDFADVAVMTKGLLALSNDLGETQGGLSGPLGDVFKTLQMAAGPSAEGNLGQALFAYDQSTAPMQKKKFNLGRGAKAVNMQKKFSEGVMQILKTKAPGSVQLLNPQELVNAMLKQPIKQIIRTFRAYPASVTHYVDDDTLMSLTKGPGGVMGILKGLADMFQGGAAAPTRG
jgi:hypothetical protein